MSMAIKLWRRRRRRSGLTRETKVGRRNKVRIDIPCNRILPGIQLSPCSVTSAPIGIVDMPSPASPILVSPAERGATKGSAGSLGLVFGGFDIALVKRWWLESHATEQHGLVYVNRPRDLVEHTTIY